MGGNRSMDDNFGDEERGRLVEVFSLQLISARSIRSTHLAVVLIAAFTENSGMLIHAVTVPNVYLDNSGEFAKSECYVKRTERDNCDTTAIRTMGEGGD